jgi:hypothetical protein
MIARRRWFSHRAPEIPRSEDMSRRSAKGSITRTGEMVDSGDWVAEEAARPWGADGALIILESVTARQAASDFIYWAHFVIADRWNAVRYAALFVGPRWLVPHGLHGRSLKTYPQQGPAVP